MLSTMLTINFVSCKTVSLWEAVLQEYIQISKTTAIHFCWLRKCTHKVNIKFESMTNPYESTIRYFSLILDRKISRNHHINHIKNLPRNIKLTLKKIGIHLTRSRSEWVASNLSLSNSVKMWLWFYNLLGKKDKQSA